MNKKHYKPAASRKSGYVGFNVTRDQLLVIEEKARSAGMAVAEYVRTAVLMVASDDVATDVLEEQVKEVKA